MISRKTARIIAEVYERTFRRARRSARRIYYTIDTSQLYDFLFDNDHPVHFCNSAKKTYQSVGTRQFKEFLMKLHTGETLVSVTPDWSWKQREKLGQRYLRDLAEDFLNEYSNESADLRKQLELDGYRFESGGLLESEADILDADEETGLIHALYEELALLNKETTFHHLDLSESHYVADRWDDSISNSRKFLESILREVAVAHSARCRGEDLVDGTRETPGRVRDYLEREGLLESKEKVTVASVYGLLSQTGGHPYMAQSEQARLLRHLALTFAQFLMLRFKGSLAARG